MNPGDQGDDDDDGVTFEDRMARNPISVFKMFKRAVHVIPSILKDYKLGRPKEIFHVYYIKNVSGIFMDISCPCHVITRLGGGLVKIATEIS